LEKDLLEALKKDGARLLEQALNDPDLPLANNQPRPSEENFGRAAGIVLRDARGFEHNAFKIELARRAIVRALGQAARGTPQSQTDKRIK